MIGIAKTAIQLLIVQSARDSGREPESDLTRLRPRLQERTPTEPTSRHRGVHNLHCGTSRQPEGKQPPRYHEPQGKDQTRWDRRKNSRRTLRVTDHGGREQRQQEVDGGRGPQEGEANAAPAMPQPTCTATRKRAQARTKHAAHRFHRQLIGRPRPRSRKHPRSPPQAPRDLKG